MPDMDGFKLLQLVRLEMDLPVIMLSTNASTEDVMKTTTHGACDYLVKPVHIKELKNIWQHVIRRKMKGYYSMDLHTNLGHRQGIFDDHVHVGSDERSARPCSQLCTRNSEHKKPQTFFWTAEMHQKFVAAVIKLGIDNMFFNQALPSKILDLMNVEKLTIENVASHLQIYEPYLKKLSCLALQK
ncbi:two-component response regulator ORR23-like [Prunus avium]|uniref:Two-component response regulator ORR23-like n=1 Tax=Prunus avium TaxID=42229 RepID=A0A6P5T2L5_PRUAV|nr:two-component response regulator ORR23-like [Prunus avium]